MTEDEEVAWINSLGFNTTVPQLRASYAKFVLVPVNPATNVLWGTESDELRNYYRLAKRTGYAPFMQQAQSWHDFMVNTYSNWQAGGKNVVEPEHVYLMGLVDWYVDHEDQPTLDAINRIIDFVLQKVSANPFYETRVTARCLMGLCHYMEAIGTRAAEVDPKIQAFLDGLAGALNVKGLICFRFDVGTGFSVQGLPAGEDLRTLFPGNVTFGIVKGQNSYDVKGFYGAGLYQDCMLMHALNVAARVRSDPSLAAKAISIASAWLPFVGPPFYDKAGAYNPLVPYYVLAQAPETSMFMCPDGGSTPLYVAQYAAFCPEAATRRMLQQEALLRPYGNYSKIQPTELGGQPAFYPWDTWEEGYFLTQK
jgi:hypothetical protein